MYGLSLSGEEYAVEDLVLRSFSHFCSSQIDSWCKDNSYVIAGYYQANERVKDARYELHTVGGGFEATEPSLRRSGPSVGLSWQNLCKSPPPKPCFLRCAGDWPDEQPGFCPWFLCCTGRELKKKGSIHQVCLCPPACCLPLPN